MNIWIQRWTVFFFSLLFHSWKSWRRWRGDNGNGGRARVLAAAVVSGVVLVVGDVIQDGATETRYMSPHPPYTHPSVHGKKKKTTNNNKKKKRSTAQLSNFSNKKTLKSVQMNRLLYSIWYCVVHRVLWSSYVAVGPSAVHSKYPKMRGAALCRRLVCFLIIKQQMKKNSAMVWRLFQSPRQLFFFE